MSDAARGAGQARAGGSRNARRRAREFALQGLYEWLLSAESAGVIEAHITESPGFGHADREHFRGMLHGAIGEAEGLRDAFRPYIDRGIETLSPVEHAVLLLGAYEFTHHPEIPYRVVINEAVELAKTFGGTDGYKYVNGVLDRVALRLRPLEAARRQGS
ncbi:MAG: transcription antitermination factor NusB [Burkholderiaceae bacterium]|nr:transcription antitermination factor NusB [Burkholderiaceae bacterium]MEB2320674.1 transcription antitermination factor NusB [Pseudomonadota bacterium]